MAFHFIRRDDHPAPTGLAVTSGAGKRPPVPALGLVVGGERRVQCFADFAETVGRNEPNDDPRQQHHEQPVIHVHPPVQLRVGPQGRVRSSAARRRHLFPLARYCMLPQPRSKWG